MNTAELEAFGKTLEAMTNKKTYRVIVEADFLEKSSSPGEIRKKINKILEREGLSEKNFVIEIELASSIQKITTSKGIEVKG